MTLVEILPKPIAMGNVRFSYETWEPIELRPFNRVRTGAKGGSQMTLQYVTDDTGNPTAVVVPIDEWDALLTKINSVEPARDDTKYLLGSEAMKKRLLEAKARSGGKSWEEVEDALGL